MNLEIKEDINPKLEVLGVIATMYEKRISDDKAILNMLKKNYNVLGIVKKQAVAKKGLLDGLSVVEQNPSSEVAEEYIKISDIIMNQCSKGVK